MSTYKTKILSYTFEDNRTETALYNCWFHGRAEVRNGDNYIRFDFEYSACAYIDDPYSNEIDGYEWDADIASWANYESSFLETERGLLIDCEDEAHDIIYHESDFEDACLKLSQSVNME